MISRPSCVRQQFECIKTVERLEERLAHITTPITVSVIGCVVNGPGEARETHIGLTGGGRGTHQVYIRRFRSFERFACNTSSPGSGANIYSPFASPKRKRASQIA